MKSYRIEWTDRTDRSVIIEAETEKEAMEKLSGMDSKNFQEESIEYLQEPYVESVEEL